MTKMTVIESRAKKHAEHHSALAATVGLMQDDMATVRKQWLPQIKLQVARARESRTSLHDAIRAAAELFVKPRTIVINGLKLGMKKGKGKLEITDEAATIALIRKHFPDKADLLIRTEEHPSKEALEQLSAAELKKLGCQIKDATDQVVITEAIGDIDKLVKALLGEDAPE